MDGENETRQCPVSHEKALNQISHGGKDETQEVDLDDELASSDSTDEGEEGEESLVKEADLEDKDIHLMLESGIQQNSPCLRRTYTQVVMRRFNDIDLHVLPEDWIEITHYSGIPIYLNRRRRVISVSRPYSLVRGSARRHAIPVSAIPCLHYRRVRRQEGQPLAHDVGCVTEDIQAERGLSDSEAVQRTVSETDAQRLHHPPPSDKTQMSALEQSQPPEPREPPPPQDQPELQLPPEPQEPQIVENQGQPADENEDMEEGEILSESDAEQEPEKSAERRKRSSNSETKPEEVPVQEVEEKKAKLSTSVEAVEKKKKSEDERTTTENAVQSTVISVQEKTNELMLDCYGVRGYCKRLFEFEERKKVRFANLRSKYRYLRTMKRMTREITMMPEKANLIRYKIPLSAGAPRNSKRDFVTNPAGKSFICILHEYCQVAMKKPPVYRFEELENSTTPYSVTVVLNGSVYGQGFGDSKKRAKLNAAMITLEMLIPGFSKIIAQIEEQSQSIPGTSSTAAAGSSGGAVAAAKAAGLMSGPGKLTGGGRGWRPCSTQDLELFDSISVTDARLQELSMRMALPGPHAILTEYLNRQCISEQSIMVEMSPKTNQRSQFTMSVKGEKVTVSCRSKREGRHLAAQALLQHFHPHITSWSGILKLYGPGSKPDRKVDQEVITELQSREKGSVKSSLIDLLRSQMKALAEEWEEHGETSKGKFFIAPSQLPFMTFHPDSQNETHIE